MDTPQRTALITGATAGIGLELAKQLAASGFRLFVTGRNPGRLQKLQRDLSCPGLAADLADSTQVLTLWEQALLALGHIDVLINNAGFNKAKDPIPSVTAEDLDASYAINLRAPFLLAREALKHMGPRKTGHIIQVISSVVFMKAENYSVYSTMKYALHGFTGSLIKEARQAGVKVTAVYPGGVNTTFRANPRPDYLQPASAARMILQCLQAPDDVVVHELTFRPMVETNF